MSKKQAFIADLEKIKELEDILSPDGLDYWNALKVTKENDKPKFTENGKMVLGYMQKNKEIHNNIFKSKEIGEGLGISSRTASGAMRKLVTDGYVEKIASDPVIYALTNIGETVDLNAEEA